MIHHLHNEREFTYELLADPMQWRERVVERVAVEDADYVTVSSSYQVRLPLRLVRRRLPTAESGDLVRLLLPLTTRHKGVLLDVDLVASSGHHCALLLKHQLARLQTDYIAWAARPPADAVGPLCDADELLYAMSAYSPAAWDQLVARRMGFVIAALAAIPSHSIAIAVWNQLARKLSERNPRMLAGYLSASLGFSVDEDQVRIWQEILGPAEASLQRSLERREPTTSQERVDPRSTAVHLLRCLPFAERLPEDVDAATEWLARFTAFVGASDTSTRALVAGYGQRWDVVVDTVIPVDVPTKVQMRTKRPWHDDAVPHRPLLPLPGTITQRVMIGDAQSGHAEVHLADHDVRIAASPRVTDPGGAKVRIPRLSALRWTDDMVSVYATGRDAPAFVDLRVRLGLHNSTHWFLWLLIAATAVSLPFLATAEAAFSLDDNVALLLLPLAGAILLARPATGASQRVQRPLRLALLILVAVAMLAAVLRPAQGAFGRGSASASSVPATTEAPMLADVTGGA